MNKLIWIPLFMGSWFMAMPPCDLGRDGRLYCGPQKHERSARHNPIKIDAYNSTMFTMFTTLFCGKRYVAKISINGSR